MESLKFYLSKYIKFSFKSNWVLFQVQVNPRRQTDNAGDLDSWKTYK